MMFWCRCSRRRSRKRYLSRISSGYSCSPNTGMRQFAGRPQHLDLADERPRPRRSADPGSRCRRAAAAPCRRRAPPIPSAASRSSLKTGRIGIGHALGDAVMVAQVDEQQAAMVADAMAPARQPRLAADIGRAQRAAGMGAIAVHGIGARQCRAERLMQGAACQGGAGTRLRAAKPAGKGVSTGRRRSAHSGAACRRSFPSKARAYDRRDRFGPKTAVPARPPEPP